MTGSGETKTAVVTGATSGLGLETSIALARAGVRVWIIGRSPARIVRAVTDVRRRSGSNAVEWLLCDLSSQAEVRHLAAEILSRTTRLDILVNNAGTVNVRRTLTVDGLEQTFAVNHLAYYLLTRLLLDRLRLSTPARIVNTASHLHYRGTLDFDDLMFERDYHVLRAYARSKLCNVLFTRELARRLDGSAVTVNAVHPGDVATNIWAGAPRWTQPIVSIAKRLFMIPALEGARRIAYLATSPVLEGVTGFYFERDRPRRPSRLACEDDRCARLWDESARLVGLDP